MAMSGSSSSFKVEDILKSPEMLNYAADLTALAVALRGKLIELHGVLPEEEAIKLVSVWEYIGDIPAWARYANFAAGIEAVIGQIGERLSQYRDCERRDIPGLDIVLIDKLEGVQNAFDALNEFTAH